MSNRPFEEVQKKIIESGGSAKFRPARSSVAAARADIRTCNENRATRHFIIFGSFVTDKTEPNDVDIFMLMEDGFDVSQVAGESHLLFDHAPAQAHFGASVFWLRRLAVLDTEEDAIADWQIKRDGNRRGIVEIIPERS